MTLVMHLGRAALVFWVAAILLPAAVAGAGTVSRHPSSATALHGVSDSAATGLDRLDGVRSRVDAADEDVRRIVARVRLETERFIARLP
jgi:hypothetical protein